MAVTGFQAENVNSGGEKFAVFKVTADSFLYPVGFTAWGSSGAINVTSTAAPFPVTLIGGNSGIEFNVGNLDTTVTIAALSTASKVQIKNDSADAIFVRGLTSSAITISTDTTVTIAALSTASKVQIKNDSADAIFVRGLTSSAITISTDTTVTIAALTSASKIQVEPVTSSATPTFVTNNSATQLYVRNDSSAPLQVKTVTDTAAPFVVRGVGSSSVPVTNSSAVPIYVRGVGDSTIPVSGTVAATRAGSSVQAGALQSFTASISSAVTTVSSSAGRLYGYSVFNPDTAGNVWLKIYPEDSAGVTLGTNSAVMDIGIPFGGGANISFPIGVAMSSGIGLAAAGGTGSTNHAAPSTALTVTVWYTA